MNQGLVDNVEKFTCNVQCVEQNECSFVHDHSLVVGNTGPAISCDSNSISYKVCRRVNPYSLASFEVSCSYKMPGCVSLCFHDNREMCRDVEMVSVCKTFCPTELNPVTFVTLKFSLG